MAGGSSDLAPLWGLPGPRVAKPSGPSSPMHHRQGTILEWDPVTLANLVDVGGTPVQNLTVWGVGEAATYRPGVKVGIACIDGSWAIIGRWVIPGTADAQDAITMLGQQTYVAIVAAAEDTTSTSFTDLLTVGPRVADVPARASGKALVTVSAHLAPADLLPGLAAMDFEITWDGGTFRSGSLETALTVAVTSTTGVLMGGSRTTLVSGLTPGELYTYTAKYRHATGAGADFQQRQLAVVNI